MVVKLYCLGHATVVEGSALEDSEPNGSGILCSAAFYRYHPNVCARLDNKNCYSLFIAYDECCERLSIGTFIIFVY